MRYLMLLLLITLVYGTPSSEDRTGDNADDPEIYSLSGKPNPEQWKLPLPPLPKLTAPQSRTKGFPGGNALMPLPMNPIMPPSYGQQYGPGAMYPMYGNPNVYGYGRPIVGSGMPIYRDNSYYAMT